jgi:hypothetical protein
MLKRKRPIRTIRPEEQLRLPIQIDQLLLDPRHLSRNKKVDHCLTKATSASSQHLSNGTYIDIFLETTPRIGAETMRYSQLQPANTHEGKMVR